MPDPTVTTARLLAEANEVKRDATDALMRGDRDKAARLMSDQSERMRRALADIDDSLPAAATLRERLAEEQAQVEKLARGALDRDAMVSRKSMMEDWSMNASGRADAERRRRSRGKRDF